MQSKKYGKKALLSSTTKRAFGNGIIGEWVCLKCGYSIYPNGLKAIADDFKWGGGASALLRGYVGPICPKCGSSLEYDEAE